MFHSLKKKSVQISWYLLSSTPRRRPAFLVRISEVSSYYILCHPPPTAASSRKAQTGFEIIFKRGSVLPKRRQTTFPVIARDSPLPATQTNTNTRTQKNKKRVFFFRIWTLRFFVFFLSRNLLFGSLLSASRLKRRSHSVDLSRILLFSPAPRVEFLNGCDWRCQISPI